MYGMTIDVRGLIHGSIFGDAHFVKPKTFTTEAAQLQTVMVRAVFSMNLYIFSKTYGQLWSFICILYAVDLLLT